MLVHAEYSDVAFRYLVIFSFLWAVHGIFLGATVLWMHFVMATKPFTHKNEMNKCGPLLAWWGLSQALKSKYSNWERKCLLWFLFYLLTVNWMRQPWSRIMDSLFEQDARFHLAIFNLLVFIFKRANESDVQKVKNCHYAKIRGLVHQCKSLATPFAMKTWLVRANRIDIGERSHPAWLVWYDLSFYSFRSLHQTACAPVDSVLSLSWQYRVHEFEGRGVWRSTEGRCVFVWQSFSRINRDIFSH